MKNLKRNIIIIIFIIAIIFIILFLINKTNKKKNNDEEENYITDTETPTTFVRGDFSEATEQEYYYIAQYVTNFLNALASNRDTAAYQMIDKNYAEKNKINENNIIDKLKFSDKYQEFEATEMYKLDLNKEATIYVIHGEIREENSEDGMKKKYEVIMNVDNINFTFSITPYKSGTLDKDSLNKDELEKNAETIEINASNSYEVTLTTQEMKAEKLLKKYISEALYYTDAAYESLEEGYRNSEFGSLEEYKKYISENASLMKNVVVNRYMVTVFDDYTEYKIIDNNGKVYLFNVTKLLNYTVKFEN